MKKRTGWDVLGIGVFLVMAFPVFWMVSTAFKPADQVNSLTPTWIPLHPTIANFKTALDQAYFWQDVKNSLIIVTATVAISIALALLAAVALARFRFTGREVFVVLVIGIQMLPQVGLIIPLYVVSRSTTW
jgi:N,N'-diacetylchitobiose transport system permease protein